MENLTWEDNLLEKKVESDLKDILKTIVGFANTVKPGHIATLLIGEKDDGSVSGVSNPDNIQRKIRETCDKIYPPIIWKSNVYTKEEKTCVIVEIEYDGETPHFGGSAWIRKGSETIKANDEIFQNLINLRNGKVFELSKWFNKKISVHLDETAPVHRTGNSSSISSIFNTIQHRWPKNGITAKIISVNNFWITLESEGKNKSEPLNKINLSFDDDNKRLKIIVSY
ncbi:MAG: ATP-binding protein [Ignavibacteria bacterium]